MDLFLQGRNILLGCGGDQFDSEIGVLVVEHFIANPVANFRIVGGNCQMLSGLGFAIG